MTPVPPRSRLLRVLAWTRVAGAVTAGLAVGGLALSVGLRFGHPALGVAALAGALLVAAIAWTPRRAARALERAQPPLGQSVQAWLESDTSALRPALEHWLAGRVAVPRWPLRWLAAAAAALLVVLVALAGPRREGTVASASSRPSAEAPAPRGPLVVVVDVHPPPYSGQPDREERSGRVEALRGARLRVRAEPWSADVTVAEAGAPARALDAAGLALVLDAPRALRLERPGTPPVVVALVPVADRPPVVTLEAPDEDRTVNATPPAVPVRAVARDDVRVETLEVRWTLAHGQGEEVRFRSGRLPARAVRDGAALVVEGRLEPTRLGMVAGDTLVVWAEGADGNAVDGPGRGRSDARTLRWETPLPELVAGKGLPLPRTGQLTERELLRRAEVLARAGLPARSRRARASELAEQQRSIRTSFGFFVAEERGDALAIDVEAPEHGEDGDVRVRRQLAAAVSAMWQAEGLLDTGDVRGALAPLREAVAALDAAFAAEKKVLAAGTPPDRPVDAARRLRGAQDGLRPAGALRRPSADGPRPRTDEVRALARRLLAAGQTGVPGEARPLGDALWALGDVPGLPAAELATRLYAAPDAPALRESARSAAAALARWLAPAPSTVPPRDAAESVLLSAVPVTVR